MRGEQKKKKKGKRNPNNYRNEKEKKRFSFLYKSENYPTYTDHSMIIHIHIFLI